MMINSVQKANNLSKL